MHSVKRILIVDDNEANLYSLKKILEKTGLSIITTLSGFEALKLAEKYSFSLVLLDIQMPEMDGFETLEKLRDTKLNEFTPVILISAIFTEDQYKLRGIKTGAVDFIPKPVNPEIIRAKVMVFLELEQHKDQLKALIEELGLKNKALKNEIKKRKKIEVDLREAKLKAEKISDMKTKFLVNMSHEIRTPVNSILGFADLISNPNLKSVDKERYVRYVSNSSQNLLFLINEILDHSRMEAGEIGINMAAFDLMELFQELEESFRQIKIQLDKSHLYLEIDEMDESVRYCESDPQRVRQILINLLSNALKYTHEGGIRFGYRKTGNLIRCYVKDTGIGIDSEQAKNIFTRFKRVETQESLQSEGTGLGLSIASRIVELLGGEIACTSEINNGSEFYFTIPYKAASLEPQASLPENNAYVEDPDWSEFTLLIAEDEEMNFMFLQEVLRLTDITIVWAKNGGSAVKIALEDPPDLVLMDVKMPDMNGFEAIKQIRESNTSIPIIVQTAFAKTDEELKTSSDLFEDYITKPINRTILLKTMAKYLR